MSLPVELKTRITLSAHPVSIQKIPWFQSRRRWLTRDYCISVNSQYCPNTSSVTFQHCFTFPLANCPHAGLSIPATTDYPSARWVNVQSTHIVAMSKQQSLGVVLGRCCWQTDFDNGVFPA